MLYNWDLSSVLYIIHSECFNGLLMWTCIITLVYMLFCIAGYSSAIAQPFSWLWPWENPSTRIPGSLLDGPEENGWVWVMIVRDHTSTVHFPYPTSLSISSGGFPVIKQEQLSPRGAASSQTENLSSQDSATSRGEFGTNHYPSSQFSFNSKRLKCRNKAHIMKRLKTLTRSHRPYASCSGWQHHQGHPWHTCAPRTFHIISRRFNHSGKKLLSVQHTFKNGKCTVNFLWLQLSVHFSVTWCSHSWNPHITVSSQLI